MDLGQQEEGFLVAESIPAPAGAPRNDRSWDLSVIS